MKSEGVFEHSNGMDALSKLNGLSVEDGDFTCYGSTVKRSNNVEDSDNLEVVLLNDLDSYLEDIEDRLAVSRMVNDSVTRGLVRAVEQEAADKIARKESELARLKDSLQLYHFRTDEDHSMRLPLMHLWQMEHDIVFDSVNALKVSVEEHLERLKVEINRVKGSTSIIRKVPSSELLGLSSLLQEKAPVKWSDMDKTLDGLRSNINFVYKQFEDMVNLSKSSLLEWQRERESQYEIEKMVMHTCIRSLQEEFGQQVLDQNAQSCSNRRVFGPEKFKELSSIRQELDVIHKFLPAQENRHLLSIGSMEHHKGSDIDVSSSNSLWESNGVHDGSMITTPENVDPAQLNHMTWGELANYFKSEMTKMKRHHELKVQHMTEQYFSLKREYLKERDSSFPAKDKEVEMLRKKILELILKLDDIIDENGKLLAFINNSKSLDDLNCRMESLQSENHQLKDLLVEKEKEIKFLSLQVSDAAERIRQHRLAEENLLKKIANCESALADSHIDASISGDLFRLLLKEVRSPVKCFREFPYKVEHKSELDIEDSDIESLIMERTSLVIFREALREAEKKLSILRQKFMSENKIRLSLEMDALEKGKALRLATSEKETLEREVRSLREKIDGKDSLLLEAANQLTEEREKYGLVFKDLDDLRTTECQQRILLAKGHEELQVTRGNLAEALEKFEQQKGEIDKLGEQLKQVTKSLHDLPGERSMLLAASQEKPSALSLTEATEADHRKQMDAMIMLLQSLSTAFGDFESRVAEDMKKISLRLHNMSYQFSSLNRMADMLKRTRLIYKHERERRSADLQKAENEVDLLGDEVDALLSILEKIYIALDHYSPILQHYPGITDILNLVKKELNGEAVKPL